MADKKIKVDRWIYNELKRIQKLKPENAHEHIENLLKDLAPFSQRTGQQNRAMHVYFNLLSDKLNEMGLEMRVILKPATHIWWTPDAVKEYLWRPVMRAMFQKESTTELEKQVEIDQIHETIMKLLGEKHGVEFIPFPVDPNRQAEKEAAEKIDYPEANGPTAFD